MIIYHNGAVIYFDGKEIFKYGIDYKIGKEFLLNIIEKNPKIIMAVEIEDISYANYDVSKHWEAETAIETNFTDLPNKNFDKIIVMASSQKTLDTFSNYLPRDLYIQMADNKLGLIMSKQATKLNGIKTILKKLNISLDNVLAFGDDFNDIEMIQNCYCGVAMSNAIEQLKATADYITFSNDEDGVAKFIDKFIL